MQFFFDMVKTLAASAVLCMVAEFLLPEGNMKKSAMIGIGLLFVLCMALPVMRLVTGGDVRADAARWEDFDLEPQASLTHEEWLEKLYYSTVTGGG